MTATNPRSRSLVRLAFAAGFAAVLALTGCKSTKDGGSATTAGGKRDPLVYGPTRIPPQNVPLPDRGAVGAKGPKSDPLLDRPVGRGSERSGVGYSDDPSRFKGTYIPGPGTTPAAMAGNGVSDELKIDGSENPDNRVPLRPVGGVRPAGGVGTGSAGGAGELGEGGLQALYADLAKYGAKRDDMRLSQENGRHVFRASVPISGSGAKCEYTGVGATPAEAVKQVLDQVIADRK
jgi:hypothetical protein